MFERGAKLIVLPNVVSVSHVHCCPDANDKLAKLNKRIATAMVDANNAARIQTAASVCREQYHCSGESVT